MLLETRTGLADTYRTIRNSLRGGVTQREARALHMTSLAAASAAIRIREPRTIRQVMHLDDMVQRRLRRATLFAKYR